VDKRARVARIPWSIVTPASPHIEAGTRVGPYLVGQRLAESPSSALFIAHDESQNRAVALTLAFDDSPAARARLLRETRALAAVDHPAILRIYGSGEHEGMTWIAAEYVHGVDLAQLIAQHGPFSDARALGWIAEAAEGLAAAHAAGVIHREIRPSNLIVTPDDHIKVVDFGFAKKREAGLVVDANLADGAASYLSPEQLEHGLADERSDIWALGCVLFELVAGEPPFGGRAAATTMAAVLRDEPVLPPHAGAAVGQIVTACLRKNSFARIGSARELAALAHDALESPDASLYSEHPSAAFRAPSGRTSQRPSASMPPTSQSKVPVSQSRVPVRSSAPPPSSRGPTSKPIRAAAPVPGRVKGTAIRAGLVWYGQRFGSESLGAIYERATPELKAILSPREHAFGIMASSWYDTTLVAELLDAMLSVAQPEDLEAYLNLITQAIAKDNVGGIYRTLFKLVASPPLLEANSQRIWRTYTDEGVLTARVPERGHMQFEIRGWRKHQPLLCRTVGFMIQNTLREVGYTALIVDRTQCVSEGGSQCEFDGLYLT
jgi:serine/threonine protein kinase